MGRALTSDFGRGFAGLKDIKNYLDSSSGRDFGILRVPANVVAAQTVTIGGDVYIVEIINTAIPGLTSIGAMTAASKNLSLVGATQAFVAGDVILAGSEMLLVSSVNTDGTYVVVRAWAGTTAAIHATNATMKMAAVPNTRAGLGRFAIPLITTLTPAAFIASFKAVINAAVADNKASSKVLAFSPVATVLIVVASAKGSLAYALAETLAGSGNAWDTAVMAGGSAPNVSRQLHFSYAVTAGDVTAGTIYLPHDFVATPSAVLVQIRTAGVAKAWDGAVAAVSPVTGVAVADVQTLTMTGGTPTAGSVVLHITDPNGTVYNTAAIAFDARPQAVQDAILEAIGGTDQDPDVECTGTRWDTGSIICTFGGRYSGLVTAMTTTDTDLNGGASSVVTHTTSGVAAGPATPGYITLDNSGTTDWAAADVIYAILGE